MAFTLFVWLLLLSTWFVKSTSVVVCGCRLFILIAVGKSTVGIRHNVFICPFHCWWAFGEFLGLATASSAVTNVLAQVLWWAHVVLQSLLSEWNCWAAGDSYASVATIEQFSKALELLCTLSRYAWKELFFKILLYAPGIKRWDEYSGTALWMSREKRLLLVCRH